MTKSTQDKATIHEYTEKLIQMTNGFCDDYLNEEYKALCEKLIRKMSRKRVVHGNKVQASVSNCRRRGTIKKERNSP